MVVKSVSKAATPCETELPISSPKDRGMMSLNDSTTVPFAFLVELDIWPPPFKLNSNVLNLM